MKDMLLERLRAWALAAVCGLMATVCPAQEGGVELRIAHTNDTHSCVMPVSPHSTDTALADKGGMVRRAALVRDLRAEDPSLLLFDCGDFSQGSAYYNLYKGEVEVRLMNTMRYDAATIGNHEFDFGMENMARIFRMTPLNRLAYLYLPSILPRFATSAGVEIGLAWKSGVAAEVIGIPGGSIGEKLYRAKIYLATPDLFAWTLTIVALSVLCERAIRALLALAQRRTEGR